MKALTSGRYDPPHIGHLLNIARAAKNYESFLVVMLDYPERRFPLCYCKTFLEESLSKHNVKVVVNKTHFGEITKNELYAYGCDLYVGGNLKVLRHIEKLGFPAEYIDRVGHWEASEIPLP